MNFERSEQQVQLHDSVSRLLADHYSFEQRKALLRSDTGRSPALWQQLAELGLCGLSLPEDCGGYGGSMADLQVLLQAFGRALLVEPVLASVVLGSTAVLRAGDSAQRQRVLTPVASGTHLLAWAHDEAGARHAPLWLQTRAERKDNRWLLSGTKCHVLHAASAHTLVVSARTHGAPDVAEGLALFLVDARANGLQRRDYRLFDDSSASELVLTQTPAEPLGAVDDAAHALAALRAVQDAGTAALCADAVGAMRGAFELTTGYLPTRKQFGRSLAENQALRHRVAEMAVNLELAQSMADLAGCAIDDPQATDSTDLMRAKLVIARQGRSLCQTAIQLHGGIGMTEEYAVGHYLRRISLFEQLLGDAGAQTRRLARHLQAA